MHTSYITTLVLVLIDIKVSIAYVVTIGPPRKKRKVTRAEKAMEKVIDAFLAHQEAAEERFERQEEERWTRETELEERRRREDREHEVRMFQIMAQAIQGRFHTYNDYYENTDTEY